MTLLIIIAVTVIVFIYTKAAAGGSQLRSAKEITSSRAEIKKRYSEPFKTPVKFDYNDIYDVDYWSKLSEDLHIYDEENLFKKESNIIDITAKNRTDIRESMIEEGYVKLDPLFDISLIIKMKALIDKLDSLSIPLSFCFIYDEFWILFMKLHSIIGAILDDDYYRL